MKKLAIIFTILLLTFLSNHFFYNKWLGYESIPDNNIFDEHDYPFVGYSFRKTGIPTGWSTMDIYKILDDEKDNKGTQFDGISINIQNQKPSLKNIKDFNYPVTAVTDVDIGNGTETIRIVQPFLDHPLFGSWLFSLGIRNQPQSFDQIQSSDYRNVSLYLSVATSFLIFIFTYLLFKNYTISLLAFVIYSIVPEYIFMSRFSLFENILIPLSLATFSLLIYAKKIKNEYKKIFIILLASILSGIAFITKESGIFIILTSIVYLYHYKSTKKEYLAYLVPLSIITLAYYAYMYILSPDLFAKLLFDQANRQWFGPLSFFYSITQPNFSSFPKSGYWIYGTLSLYLTAFKQPKKTLLFYLPYFVYLFIFLIMGGLNYPWYYLPLLPFIVIASAYSIHRLISKPNIVDFSLFFLLVFSSSFYWGYYLHNDINFAYMVYRLSLIIFPIIYIAQKLKRNYLTRFLWLAILLILLIQIYQWNNQAFLYITDNWRNLPNNFSFPY